MYFINIYKISTVITLRALPSVSLRKNTGLSDSSVTVMLLAGLPMGESSFLLYGRSRPLGASSGLERRRGDSKTTGTADL